MCKYISDYSSLKNIIASVCFINLVSINISFSEYIKIIEKKIIQHYFVLAVLHIFVWINLAILTLSS